jgi:hypothetical protein
MENSGIQSQRSMSSISTVAQSSDQHAAGSSSNPNEFVSQGKFTIFVSYLPYQSTMLVPSVKLCKSLVDYLSFIFHVNGMSFICHVNRTSFNLSCEWKIGFQHLMNIGLGAPL